MRKMSVLAALACAAVMPFSVAWADNWTDLRAAVYYNQEAEVVRLLNSGVDINLQNDEGWTALHVAAEQGMTRMVNYLLARGADPNLRTTRGRTAYDVAAGYSEVQAALRAKMAPAVDPFADVLGPQRGAAAPAPTPGRAAAGGRTGSRNGNDGRSDAMRPRLEARDAVWYNNLGDLEALLDAGLDVNMLDDGGETLLHAAAWRDRIDIARVLIARGADGSIRDGDGKRPADYARSPEMRALLGPARQTPARPTPATDEDHCKRMWQEATALCGLGSTSCNTSAHIRYQQCQRTGTWY